MDEVNANDPAFISALMDAVRKGAPVKWPVFARLTGTQEAAVKRAWVNGDLPSCPVESIPIREGVIALRSIPKCLRKKAGPPPEFLSQADALARSLLGLPARNDESVDVQDDEITALKIKYLKAQTASRAAQAIQRQLEADIKKGLYVKKADVELDAATTAANIAGALNRLPARVSGLCEGRSSDEIARILQKEIKLIFDEIQASAFTGDWSDL